ncbi:phytoene desaturase family protein [Thalassobaculum sp. OXR-137]|uniref:phytoene desaturase family protein n=1 Tax=Thalassobaculum sp. OXR-137 TaxID=3100173 RepID=UPI002AC95F69|nr:phytoene desaturase family protein [Thalassobaculum sp. OXR-137]WPZ36800.1 phytoene desaturase family protein [Thalassobaculum sp. OXR-137]
MVIGAGFGGLAAAIRLGARGYRVTVLEKLDAPGGRAFVFRQDGFTFDAGPTIITVPFVFEELWTLAGRRFADDIDLRELDPFYRISLADGRFIDVCRDEAEMRRRVDVLFPGEGAGFLRFQAECRRLCDLAFLGQSDRPMHDLVGMAKLAPDLLTHGALRSVHGLAAKYVRDPDLRAILSFHPLLIGGDPFKTTAVYALIPELERRWGVHFAMGGTGALVQGLARLIAGQGSEIRCAEEVDEILVEGGRATGVRLGSGETLAADLVVSNADPGWTYGHLLRRTARRRWTERKVARARYSMSLFVWYFGTDKRYEDVPHHSILLGPRYRGLLDDIFRRKTLADDFSLYLHRPTATDPSLAPPGHDAFYVLSPVPNLSADIDWESAAEPYRRRIERHLSDTVLPGLAQSVVSSHVVTPPYFRDRLNTPLGAGFSLQPLLTQSAWFRPHNRSEEVEGLYLVGAGTHPGAGVPGVLCSAKILDTVVPHAETLR